MILEIEGPKCEMGQSLGIIEPKNPMRLEKLKRELWAFHKNLLNSTGSLFAFCESQKKIILSVASSNHVVE